MKRRTISRDQHSILERKCSLHERYELTNMNTGHGHTITYLYRYPSAYGLPSTDFLESRVATAQQSVEHLFSEVIDGETNKPSLRLRSEGAWPSEAIVRDDTYEGVVDGDTGERAALMTEGRMLEKEIARMRERMSWDVPPWQVTRYLTSDGDPTPQAYIAISAYHHLIDGVGGLRLAQSLLSETNLASAPGLSPAMEDIVPIKPSLSYLAKEALHELVIPKLPSSLRTLTARRPCWPAEQVGGKPTDFPEAQSTVNIPAPWIQPLKEAGKVNGVTTLHPIIQTALITALNKVMKPNEGSIDVCSPHDERDLAKGHPEVGSVIISTLRKSYPHAEIPPPPSISNRSSGRQRHQARFWALARDTGDHYASPETQAAARYAIGAMAYIPDPDPFTSPYRDDPARSTPTGWEDFLWKNIERPAPFRTSMMISNLGKIESLPPGCDGMRWSQSAWPFEDALIICLASHEEGMDVTASFRDGCAVNQDQVEQILHSFKNTLESLLQEV